jgi:hypothetical protein
MASPFAKAISLIVANLAMATGHAMQFFNDLHCSNLYKCIVLNHLDAGK